MLPKILLGVGLFAAVFALLIFSGKLPIGNKAQIAQGDVMLWGTIPEAQMNSVIQAFNPQAKTYAVRYKYIPEAVFNQQLLEALASGTGPDAILTPYQIILAQQERLYPFPIASFGEKNFKDTYVDGAGVLFSPQGALGLPISIDPMVLFYNRTLFSKHGLVNAPTYWDEVASVAPSLTLREGGKFTESAIALGTPGLSYTKDLIMAIVAQLGQTPVVSVPLQAGGSYMEVLVNTPVNESSQILPLATVNRFVTQFGDPGQRTYSWSESLGDASDMFIGERLAMYIGYAGELQTLRARNPRASFEMTYLPQTKGYNTFATGMRMYAIATLKSSKNLQAALTVESQFASGGVAPAIATYTGGVPAMRTYATTPGLDPVVARSMLVARGWYDSHSDESTAYVDAMISDIINYRYGISDASSIFVSRLRDLYTKK